MMMKPVPQYQDCSCCEMPACDSCDSCGGCDCKVVVVTQSLLETKGRAICMKQVQRCLNAEHASHYTRTMTSKHVVESVLAKCEQMFLGKHVNFRYLVKTMRRWVTQECEMIYNTVHPQQPCHLDNSIMECTTVECVQEMSDFEKGLQFLHERYQTNQMKSGHTSASQSSCSQN